MPIKTSDDKMSREQFVAKLAELFGVQNIDENAEHLGLFDAQQLEKVATDYFGLAPSSIIQSVVGRHVDDLYKLHIHTSSG